MTDQEIIKALRICDCVAFDECECCPAKDGDTCDSLMSIAADRLEELTASQHVMTMREDA